MDDIDLYLGGFLEAAHGDSILGPVFKCIIGDQFARWVITVHIVVCINVILIFFAILIIIVIIIVIIIIVYRPPLVPIVFEVLLGVRLALPLPWADHIST